jgi:hypothetical protein
MVRKTLLFFFFSMLIPASLFAKIEDRVLKEGISIAPGDAYLLTIDSDSPAKLAVYLDKASPCETECLAVMQVNDAYPLEFKTKSSLTSDYSPRSGKIEMKYRNISQKPVVIHIHRYVYHCEAEACALLKKKGIDNPIDFASKHGEYKRLIMSSIDSLTTSADGSWSDVSGTTLFGDPFDVTIIWWKYDPESEISCGRGSYIERYKKQMSEGGGPALIDGSLVNRDRPIFISVSTCTGRPSSRPKGPDDL